MLRRMLSHTQMQLITTTTTGCHIHFIPSGMNPASRPDFCFAPLDVGLYEAKSLFFLTENCLQHLNWIELLSHLPTLSNLHLYLFWMRHKKYSFVFFITLFSMVHTALWRAHNQNTMLQIFEAFLYECKVQSCSKQFKGHNIEFQVMHARSLAFVVMSGSEGSGCAVISFNKLAGTI